MILASKSPRRKEILENFGFNLKIATENVDEVSDKIEITDQIMDISRKKTIAVAVKNPDEYVVGADTVVELDGKILGKPKDSKDAFDMLRALSGKKNRVITAYTIICLNKNIEINNYETTDVYFKELKDEEINWYIGTLEPMDKAGAYGVQGKGAVFVDRIDGDFFGVVGFPIGKFIENLKRIGVSLEEVGNI